MRVRLFIAVMSILPAVVFTSEIHKFDLKNDRGTPGRLDMGEADARLRSNESSLVVY